MYFTYLFKYREYFPKENSSPKQPIKKHLGAYSVEICLLHAVKSTKWMSNSWAVRACGVQLTCPRSPLHVEAESRTDEGGLSGGQSPGASRVAVPPLTTWSLNCSLPSVARLEAERCAEHRSPRPRSPGRIAPQGPSPPPPPVLFLVQSPSRVWLFVAPGTAARQTSLSLTISRNLSEYTFTASATPSNYLILCCPLLLLPFIFPFRFQVP